jgi:flagella basal body P-ring formation protein FlgA
MKKLLIIGGFLASFFSTTPVYSDTTLDSGALGSVSLRENISVDSTYIRLSDLFTNVPEDKADTAVAYAPKPGRRAAFDARWLYRVARAYGLEWRPLSADLRTLVSRDSIIVQKQEILEAIQDALVHYDLPDNPMVELSNRNLRVHVPSNILPEVRIEDITFNARSNRFGAVVAIGEKDMNVVERIRVSGQVHRMLEIPTLSRRLAKGEIITEHDITWVKARADRTQRNVIVNAEDIIGMTPKRGLQAERPIRATDIQRPVIVPKGSIVTIILKKPGMTLTATGRAMQNGADGETIRVNNAKTKRTIEAIVIGSGMVTVLPGIDKPAQLASIQN